LRQLRVVVLVEVVRQQVGQLAEEPGVGAQLGVVLDQADQLESGSPVGVG
jgi:hypothetical protein